MLQYAWTYLNTVEFGWGHCAHYWAVIDTETYSEHSQKFKMESFAKRIIPKCKARQGRLCGTKALW